MRISFLVLAMVALFSFSAHAEDENVIKIVQPDGSVVVVKMPEPQKPPSPPEPAPVPSPAEVKEQIRKQEAPPVPMHDEGPPPAPKPAKPKPLPTRAESEGRIKNPEPAPLPVLPPTPGVEITKEKAMEIALQDAPPARSMTVVKRSLNGRLVWVVTFRTDAGTNDVLVDTQTGEIVIP